MEDYTHQSPNSKSNKDSHFQNEYLKVYQYLYQTSATRKEVSVALKIDRANICWYVGKLRKSDRVWVIRKKRCSYTRHIVEEITCNPDLKPDDNQLKLFS